VTCNKDTIGWRCWYDDGSEQTGSRFDDWCKLAESNPEKCLVKMLYYCDGTKQIQTSDWWYEAPHERGVIRATCSDKKKPEIEKRYPEAIFIEGFWTVDEWFTECREAAMASSYGSNI
jgi:hypothetical protein